MARHLMKENTKLLKKVDKLEYQLSHAYDSSRLNEAFPSIGCLPLIEEDIPLAIATLKSKLTQSEETITKQRLQLEAQDARVLELEHKLNSISDSVLVAQLSRSHSPIPEAKLSKRTSVLLENGYIDTNIRGFVTENFKLEKALERNSSTISHALRSPVHISPTGEQLPLPIYSTGILKEPLSPIDLSSVSASQISSPAHSRNSSLNQLVKSMSISSLAKDIPSQFTSGKSKRQPSSNENMPSRNTEKRVMEATLKGLEVALQDSYQQHTSLHTSIHKLSARLESSEFLLKKQKESHKQALDTLMDQIERSKLEAASFQRQLQDITRENATLNGQLQETLAQLSAQEKKPRFFCF